MQSTYMSEIGQKHGSQHLTLSRPPGAPVMNREGLVSELLLTWKL